MIYFCADLHLCHPYVASLRGFSSSKKHDEFVVKHVNSTVGSQDELYVCGDVSSGSRSSVSYACSLLRHLYVPRKRRHLVLGNHENFKSNNPDLFDVFGTVSLSEYLFLEGTSVVLTHLPLRSYMLSGAKDKSVSSNSFSCSLARRAVEVPEGVVHLCGHTHSQSKLYSSNPMSVNVGLDAWNFKVASWPDVLSLVSSER